MSSQKPHRDHSSSEEELSAPGVQLTEDERRAIQAAAEAEGYSEPFADLLYRFAELIGTEEVLGELKKMEPKDPGR